MRTETIAADPGSPQVEGRKEAPATPLWPGLALAAGGSIAFSGKAIIVKLAYRHGVDAVTLIMYRMLFALPLFVAMAWWAGRGKPALTRRDLLVVTALGFSGYYLSSFQDFMGLHGGAGVDADDGDGARGRHRGRPDWHDRPAIDHPDGRADPARADERLGRRRHAAGAGRRVAAGTVTLKFSKERLNMDLGIAG